MIELSFKLVVDERGLNLTQSSKSSTPKDLEAQLMSGLIPVVKNYFQGAAKALESEAKARQISDDIGNSGDIGNNGTGNKEPESRIIRPPEFQ